MPRGSFSTSNYMLAGSAQATSGDITVAGWIYPTSTATLAQIWGLNYAAGTSYFLRLTQAVGGAINAGWRSGGSALSATTLGTVTLNAWNFVALRFFPHATDANSLRATLGLEQGPYISPVATWPVNIDRTAIGARYATAGVAQEYAGYIGPLAVWTSILDDAQLALLAGGLDLRCLPGAPPAAFYRMTGDGNAIDTIGSFDLAEVGAVPEYTTSAPVLYIPPPSCVITRIDDRIRVAWETDVEGDCVIGLGELDGILHRLDAIHTGLAGTYDVRVLDAYGADVLMGLGAGIAYDSAASKIITLSDQHLRVPVMGRHRMTIDAGDDQTSGVLELTLTRDLARRAIR